MVSRSYRTLLDYKELEGMYRLRLKGQAGLDQVLSVQVPTYFCWSPAGMQYKLLTHMLPGWQQELTFASGLQGKSAASSSLVAW